MEVVGTWSAVAAEAELNRFLDRQAQKNVQERPEEAMYAESVRRYHARRRKEIRTEWYCYFCHLADSLRSRAAEYDQRAEALLEDRGEGL